MADRVFKLKFIADVANAVGDIDKLGDKIGGMGGKAKLATGAALAGGAAIGAVAAKGFMSAITIAAKYEEAIDQVGAVAGATAEQTKRLYDTGKRIGQETAFSATEAAAAMEELAAQGLSVDQIVNGAADATVALAAAGKTDLVTAATAAAQTMGVFGVKAEDMTDVVNRMAGAANFSQFNVTDMTLAIGQGAGVAAAAGVSYQDFLASIAGTSKAFTSGSDAGTGFKTFIQRLVPTGKAATNAMRDLGLITKEGHNRFFTAQGDFAGMANAAEILKEGLGDLSDEARTDALKDIFGSDASRTAAELSKLGGAGFTDISTGMGNTDAAAVAAQRMDNLAGSLERLKGSLETIGISLGEKFLPGLTTAVEFLAVWLPKIPDELILVVGGLALFIGMMSALGLAILPFIGAAGMLTAMGLGIGGITLALLGIPLAIAAVIAAGALLFTHWDEITEKAAGVRNAILSTVGVDTTTPGRSPAKIGANALAQGGIAAIPLYGQIYGAVRGAKSLQNMFGGGSKSTMGELSPEGLATGGLITRTGLAIVDRGERVLRPDQQGGIVINNYIAGSVHSEASLQAAILESMNAARRRGALGFT